MGVKETLVFEKLLVYDQWNLNQLEIDKHAFAESSKG